MEYKLFEWTDETIKRFWDYESQFPQNYFAYQCGKSLCKKFKNYLKKGSNVLDYGAGPGFLIPHLISRKKNVTAVEFSLKLIEDINKKYTGNPFFKGAYSLDEILNKNMKFDVIFLIEVIEHLNDYYLQVTFENIKKLLSPDGIVIITTPNDEDLAKSYILCPVTNTVFHRWQHVRSWNKDSLKKYLEGMDFKILKIDSTFLSIGLLRIFYIRIKNLIKKILGLNPKKDPHLYCIVTIK